MSFRNWDSFLRGIWLNCLIVKEKKNVFKFVCPYLTGIFKSCFKVNFTLSEFQKQSCEIYLRKYGMRLFSFGVKEHFAA